jgi:hypothetical protein
MFNETHEALKYDNRLRSRRDWISPDELAQELAALPDSGDKILAPGEEPAVKPSAVSVAPPTPAPPVVEAAPVTESAFAPVGDSAPESAFAPAEESVFAPAADPQPTASFGGNDADDAADAGDDAGSSDGSDFGGTNNA